MWVLPTVKLYLLGSLSGRWHRCPCVEVGYFLIFRLCPAMQSEQMETLGWTSTTHNDNLFSFGGMVVSDKRTRESMELIRWRYTKVRLFGSVQGTFWRARWRIATSSLLIKYLYLHGWSVFRQAQGCIAVLLPENGKLVTHVSLEAMQLRVSDGLGLLRLSAESLNVAAAIFNLAKGLCKRNSKTDYCCAIFIWWCSWNFLWRTWFCRLLESTSRRTRACQIIIVMLGAKVTNPQAKSVKVAWLMVFRIPIMSFEKHHLRQKKIGVEHLLLPSRLTNI